MLFVTEHVGGGIALDKRPVDEPSGLANVSLLFPNRFVVVLPAIPLGLPAQTRYVGFEAVPPVVKVSFFGMFLWHFEPHAGGLELPFQAELGNFGLIEEAPRLNVLGDTPVVVAKIKRTCGSFLPVAGTQPRFPFALVARTTILTLRFAISSLP